MYTLGLRGTQYRALRKPMLNGNGTRQLGLRSALAELYNNTVSHVTDNIITS